MKKPEKDALAISALMLTGVLAVWLGVGGPIFNIDFSKLNDTGGIASWAQAVIAGVAIIVVYVAASIPVRSEARYRLRERELQAAGLALLILPDLLTLKGEVESSIEHGSINDDAIQIPHTLAQNTDKLYIFEEIGGRMLQTIGILNGIESHRRRFWSNIEKTAMHPARIKSSGDAVWENQRNLLRLCLLNIDEAIGKFDR